MFRATKDVTRNHARVSLLATDWVTSQRVGVRRVWRKRKEGGLSDLKTRVQPKNIVYYTVQTTPLCPIDAIVLHTAGRERICADPGRDWVRKAMGKVDEAKTIKREEEEGK
ncbi:unnamed protein product [Coregonus sp. 'balchen']|nr:unnamed protein product [Coregonus sp. 'balchen']